MFSFSSKQVLPVRTPPEQAGIPSLCRLCARILIHPRCFDTSGAQGIADKALDVDQLRALQKAQEFHKCNTLIRCYHFIPDFREAPMYGHVVKENTVAWIRTLHKVTHAALNIQPLAIPGTTSRRPKGAGRKGHMTPTATCAPKSRLQMYDRGSHLGIGVAVHPATVCLVTHRPTSGQGGHSPFDLTSTRSWIPPTISNGLSNGHGIHYVQVGI